MRGLLGRRSLGEREALLLERTRSIHTFGMRFPIAVVLLDRSSEVLAVRRVGTSRLVLPRPGVRHVLECAPDTDIRAGDRLRIWEEPRPEGRTTEDLRQERPDEEPRPGGYRGQEREHQGEGEGRPPADPGREHHRFSAIAVGANDPQVLEQRPHG
jgi:hypothetical protein